MPLAAEIALSVVAALPSLAMSTLLLLLSQMFLGSIDPHDRLVGLGIGAAGVLWTLLPMALALWLHVQQRPLLLLALLGVWATLSALSMRTAVGAINAVARP